MVQDRAPLIGREVAPGGEDKAMHPLAVEKKRRAADAHRTDDGM
jgi:hypothetical protein